MTLQTQSNQISSTLSGVETQTASSDNNTNKRVICNEYKANGYGCIYTLILEQYRLLQLVYWCAYLHIINTLLALAELFCFVGWGREYNSQLAGKYLSLDLLLVSNHPITFENKTTRS